MCAARFTRARVCGRRYRPSTLESRARRGQHLHARRWRAFGSHGHVPVSLNPFASSRLRSGHLCGVCVCARIERFLLFLFFADFFSDCALIGRGIRASPSGSRSASGIGIRYSIRIRAGARPRAFALSSLHASVNQDFSLAEDPISASGLLAVNPIAFGTICSNMRALESCVRLVSSCVSPLTHLRDMAQRTFAVSL